LDCALQQAQESTMSKKKKKAQTLPVQASAPAPARISVQKTEVASINSKMNPKNEEIKMESVKNKAERMSADAAAMGKEQTDAFMQSGNMLMKGAENFIKTYVSLMQDSVERNTEAVKSLMSCKTLNELTETQTRLAQDNFDGFISNMARLSEMSVKLATESFEPLNAQMNKSMRKATDSMAA
jgi:phasin family protein